MYARIKYKLICKDFYKICQIPISKEHLLIDFKFWFILSERIRIVPMIDIVSSPSNVIYGSSDASKDFGGYFIGSFWSSYEFTHVEWISSHSNGPSDALSR
eukprot:75203_1